MQVILIFGLKNLCIVCKNSTVKRMREVVTRSSLVVLEKKINNLSMSERSTNNPINNNNFQTDFNSSTNIIDGSYFGHNNYVPANNGNAGGIQESIINTNSQTIPPCYQAAQIPYMFPYGWNYQTLPAYPQYHPAPHLPVFSTGPYNPVLLVYHNFLMPQTTSTYNMYPNDSHRRYFHRHRDVTEGRKRKQHINTDIMSLRLWEKTDVQRINSAPGFIFTLMSYNVLAQDLLEMHPYLYREHDQEALKWDTRWRNLFDEIKKFSPDILCLQEVQESHIEPYYSLLETLGYKGLFKKRTGNQSDGCAIYYKEDYINLIEQMSVEFRQKAVPVLDRDNVGIIAKFAPKLYPTQEFIVATTHLLYNPRRDDIRLAQMQVLLTEVERISYKKHKSENGNGSYLPVLLTGDLNSPPHSDLYEFLTHSKLDYEKISSRLLENVTLVTAKLGINDNCQHVDLLEKRNYKKDLTRSEELELIDINHSELKKKKGYYNVTHNSKLLGTGKLSHKFELKSVYDHGMVKCNEATTYQDKWLTVDYIFYSVHNTTNQDKMKLLAKYRLPTGDELGNVSIPNQSLGSDHLSLIAKFKLEF